MKYHLFFKICFLIFFILITSNIKTFANNSDFTYKLDSNGNASITAYKGSASNITIPSNIDGHEVKKIDRHAFNENRNNTNGKILKNVIISEGITAVDDFAFVDCTNLETITLPNTLNSLGSQTFIGCSNLSKINIPSSLEQFDIFVFQETGFSEFTIPEHFKSIGDSAFRICKNLKKFKVYSKNVKYHGNVFENCSNDLVLYGFENSTTQSYAEEHGLQFQILTEDDINDDENNTNIPISSITLNKTSLTLYVGDTQIISTTILPGNANNTNIIWSSSNENVATVQNGEITAVGIGQATIIASTEDSTCQATCIVNVFSNDNNEVSQNSIEHINNVTTNTMNSKDTNTNKSTPVDKTIANKILPYTGSGLLITSSLILLIIVLFSYIKYKKYKDKF